MCIAVGVGLLGFMPSWIFLLELAVGVRWWVGSSLYRFPWWKLMADGGSGQILFNKTDFGSGWGRILGVVFSFLLVHGGREEFGRDTLSVKVVLVVVLCRRRPWRGMKEDDEGSRARWWCAGVGSASLLRGRPDPVRDELGAWCRPIQLHCLDPSRRRRWLLRLLNALWLGVLPALVFLEDEVGIMILCFVFFFFPCLICILLCFICILLPI